MISQGKRCEETCIWLLSSTTCKFASYINVTIIFTIKFIFILFYKGVRCAKWKDGFSEQVNL